MEVHEFGKENSQKIVLIPGNMMCWRQFEPVIPLLEQKYHIIAISTDGYDGSGKTTFTTAVALILYDEIDRFTPRPDAKVAGSHDGGHRSFYGKPEVTVYGSARKTHCVLSFARSV